MLHVDLDAFYASVEQRERPELRGRPVVVGGLGSRGVVAAASYEARRFGIHSAMPMARARRVCPDAAFVSPRLDLYSAVSRNVMEIFREATPAVEPLSLDEAFLDVSGATRLLGTGPEIAESLRARIRGELELAASVGVASTKMLAKIASDLAKPDGLLVVDPGSELEFLHPLPVRRLWGVGPATAARLGRYGVVTVGDLARIPEATLVGALGQASGRHLHALAWNRDDRAVEPSREMKSVSHEETFPTDRNDREGLEREVLRMADRVAARLRAAGTRARTVGIKVRFGDFTTITRAHTLTHPTDEGSVFADSARGLLRGVDLGEGIRLLGVAASQFDAADAEVVVQGELALDPPSDEPGAGRDRSALQALERTVDAVRDRFGRDAVGRAGQVEAGRLRTDRRGSLWGPDEEGT